MKRGLSFFMLLIIAQFAFSQFAVKGFVVDKATDEPLVGVTVINPKTNQGTITALDGSFSVKLPKGDQELKITYIGYLSKTIRVSAANPDAGIIYLETEAIGLNDITVTSSVAVRRKTPVALSVISPLEIEERLGTQEFPEVLKSTPGVYATKQGGGFGDSRVNIRGFSSENVAMMINGVPMNDMEWGGIYWSNWAGLSDVTRSMQVQRGLGASKVAAPSLGGSINIVTRSTDAVKGGAFSYGIGNDGYSKISFSVSTGLTEKKWAITLLGSKTVGDGYIQGTEFESYSYFVNISKIVSDVHQLSFTAFAAPQWHNQRNNNDKLTVKEWQKQPLKYRYNPSYGFDMNGQRKVSAYNVFNKPQLSLNHFWTINEKSSLSTAIYASIGNGYGYGGQGYDSTERNRWFGASNGVPNAQVIEIKDENNKIEDVFKLRSEDGTFDYGEIYRYNTYNDKDRKEGSKMVMSKSVNQHRWFGALSTFNSKIGQHIDIYGGIDLRYYKGIHTNEIVDLYGGEFFIDASSARPLLNNKDWETRKLGVGDVVYRDYDGYVISEGLFGQAEYNKDKLSAFISLSLSNTSYWRYDRFYYDADQALSETVNFLGYCAKGGANYNLTENHNVFANIGIISRAPFYSGGAFLQSTTSNITNPNAVNEKAFSAEIGYGYRSRYFSGNLNVYRTNWIDKTMVRAVNANSPESLVANMEGVNALHQGIEFDFVAKPFQDLEIRGMLSIGDWYWQNNASGYLYNRQGQPTDKQGNIVGLLSPEHSKVNVNLEGIHVGNSAQTTAALGFSYQILKGFRIGMDGNYFGRNYAYFNLSSTGSTLDDSTFGQPWMIPDGITFDFSANYRFKIGNLDASLIGNINNLFDAEYITDATDGSKHDYDSSTVFYGFGRTWSTSLKIRF